MMAVNYTGVKKDKIEVVKYFICCNLGYFCKWSGWRGKLLVGEVIGGDGN